MTDAHTFSKIDADRILKRASEIEGSEDARRLTLDELRLIAGEAGFGPRAVERAIAEAQSVQALDVRRPPVQKWGLVITRLSTTREIPTGLTAEQLMRAVRLFQPYRDGPAHVELQEREITWCDRRGLQFTITSVGRSTEIHVFVSKLLLRKEKWREWVKAAADRLEMLVLMVASRDAAHADPPGRPPAGARGEEGGR
jgi:hypothetical protein